MGESICLVRSFSQPAEISSRESNEAVSHRFLTESVSFGRFASESLQWEKWSAFTQNRYLEEVERYTKPGSVAQKKAFFEAHFKNRAAERSKQTKTEEVSDEIVCQVQKEDNLLDSEVPLVEINGVAMDEVNAKASDEIVCEVRKDRLVDSEKPLVANNGVAMDEVRHEEVSNAEVDSVIDETTGVETGQVKDPSVESFNSMAVPEGEVLDHKEDLTSLSKERRPISSGSKTCSTSSNLDLPLKKTRKEPASSSKRSISVSKGQNRPPREPFNMSISSTSSTNAKSAGKADKKRSSGSTSLQMPLNVASSARQTTKTAPTNLARKSTTQETTSSNVRNSVLPNGNEPTGASKSRKRPFSQTTKEDSKAAKCSTSAPTVRLPELLPPNNRLSEDKRKNITVGSSVSCRIPLNVKREPSVGYDNRSTHNRIKAKSLTVSSPFNFRSDERAEKRKEFFKKLEEKNRKEDTGKEQLFCGFKAQKTRLVSEEGKNLQVPFISPTSPRFRTNQTPRRGNNIKKSHQSPHKVASSVKTRNAVMEKPKSCKIHPSQTKKKTQENLSPNILQN